MKIITLYTTPNCRQCKLTKARLDERGIVYSTVDLTESLDDYRAVKELGYTQAPVVIVNTGERDVHWSGFRPDLIKKHLAV